MSSYTSLFWKANLLGIIFQSFSTRSCCGEKLRIWWIGTKSDSFFQIIRAYWNKIYWLGKKNVKRLKNETPHHVEFKKWGYSKNEHVAALSLIWIYHLLGKKISWKIGHLEINKLILNIFLVSNSKVVKRHSICNHFLNVKYLYSIWQVCVCYK